MVEVVDVQPRQAELGGQTRHAVVAQHPPGLRLQRLGSSQLAGCRELCAAPRRASTTRGSSSAGWPAPSPTRAPRLFAGGAVSRAIQERRRDEHAGQRQADRFLVRQFLLAKLAVEVAQAASFSALGKRPAVGPLGELQHGVELARLAFDQALPERGGRVEIGWRSGSNLRVGVLRGVLPELLEGIDQSERVVADEVELVPEPIELRLLRRRASAG